jgi:hypothetical protein
MLNCYTLTMQDNENRFQLHMIKLMLLQITRKLQLLLMSACNVS